MKRRWSIRWLGTALVAASLASCTSFVPEGQSRSANNRIMLVRQEPATLGYQRTAFLRSYYPAFGDFINRQGFPDFIAETESDKRHFIVLYYPEHQSAYSCRGVQFSRRDVEFTGPIKITRGEVAVLKRLKREARDMPPR